MRHFRFDELRISFLVLLYIVYCAPSQQPESAETTLSESAARLLRSPHTYQSPCFLAFVNDKTLSTSDAAGRPILRCFDSKLLSPLLSNLVLDEQLDTYFWRAVARPEDSSSMPMTAAWKRVSRPGVRETAPLSGTDWFFLI